MAYRFDKNSKELIIDGWEKGIAPSPYEGIANIRNVNTNYYPGVAYENYRRQAATLGSVPATIGLDNSAYIGSTAFVADGTTHTLSSSYTCSGSNRALLVQTSQTHGTPNGVTYGGVSMTKITDALTSNNIGQSLWYLLNPTVGSNTLTVSTTTSYSATITFDQVVTFTTASSASITPTAGGKNCLLVIYALSGTTGNTCTVDSNATTHIGTTDLQRPGASAYSNVWIYKATAGSAHTVSFGNSGSGFIHCYFNVDQTTPVEQHTDGQTASLSITPANANEWMVAFYDYSTGPVTYTGSPQTQRGSGAAGVSTDSNGVITQGSPYTMGVSNGGNVAEHALTLNSASSGGTVTLMANAISFDGVKQTGFPDASTSVATTNQSSESLTLSTVANNCWTVMAVSANPNTTATAGAGTTIRQDNTASSNEIILADSNGALASGSHSLTVNFSGSVSDPTAIMVSMAPVTFTMGNPVQHAQSPAGINYILDSNGNIWKQSAVNSSTFNPLTNGTGRIGAGAGGLAYWNNYLIVIGANLIETCGDGTGDAGVISSNWNLNSGSTFSGKVNITFAALTFQCTGSILAGATSATLAATWPYATNTNATIIFSDGETRTITVTNGSAALSWSVGLSNNVTSLVFISSPAIFLQTSQTLPVGTGVVFSSSGGSVPSPLVAGTTYYVVSAPTASGSGYVFQVSATIGGSAIIINDQGSGTLTYSVASYMTLPTGNVTNMVLTGVLSPGDTTATISTYTTPSGIAVSGVWVLATGTYNLVDPNGNNISSVLTNGSSTVSFLLPIGQYAAASTYQVQILNPSATIYRAYVSKVDGNLYFANGRYMGRMLSQNANINMNTSNPNSYTVSYGAFSVLDPNDSITDMTDLQSNQIVAGKTKIYSWDYVSPETSAPIPIGENISRVLNLLNNVYVFAGQKGNIYTSNGSYAQLLLKIPDYIAGAIDPVWTYGGVMTHRSRIFFQALAQDTAGNNLIAGVFSIIVSPSMLGEVSNGIVMDAQNSYGITPSAGATGAGILIDNEPSSNGQDSYYSAWSNGASTGGIDYNDTSVWQAYEPTIETDMMPIGTFLDKMTLGQMQFKLDRPMVSGDKIRVYARASLSDAYTLVGETTSQQLSDAYPSNLSQSQWIQYKIQTSGASSNSSRVPLREIRVQTQ